MMQEDARKLLRNDGVEIPEFGASEVMASLSDSSALARNFDEVVSFDHLKLSQEELRRLKGDREMENEDLAVLQMAARWSNLSVVDKMVLLAKCALSEPVADRMDNYLAEIGSPTSPMMISANGEVMQSPILLHSDISAEEDSEKDEMGMEAKTATENEENLAGLPFNVSMGIQMLLQMIESMKVHNNEAALDALMARLPHILLDLPRLALAENEQVSKSVFIDSKMENEQARLLAGQASSSFQQRKLKIRRFQEKTKPLEKMNIANAGIAQQIASVLHRAYFELGSGSTFTEGELLSSLFGLSVKQGNLSNIVDASRLLFRHAEKQTKLTCAKRSSDETAQCAEEKDREMEESLSPKLEHDLDVELFLLEIAEASAKRILAPFEPPALVEKQGILYTFGKGDHGKLGHGKCTDIDPTPQPHLHEHCPDGFCTENVKAPRKVDSLSDVEIKKVVSLSTHSVALTTEGVLYTWGNGDKNRLGHGTTAKEYSPRIVNALLTKSAVNDIACGLGHTLALLENGHLYAWGNGGNGRLGVGDTEDRAMATLLTNFVPHSGDQSVELPQKGKKFSMPPGINLASIHCGASHSMAITDDGRAFTWGKNNQGQCGHGDVVDKLCPTLVQMFCKHTDLGTDLDRDWAVKQMSGGWEHSLAVTRDGRIFSFGSGYKDSRRPGLPPVLGHGGVERELQPRQIMALQHEMVVDSACGWDHSLAVTKDGHVYTWGAGTNGKLGHGDEESHVLPQRVESLARSNIFVVQVEAGCEHSVAVSEEGYLFTWGHGDSGRLGHPSPRSEKLPRRVESLVEAGLPVVSVAVGDKYNLVIVQNTERKSSAELEKKEDRKVVSLSTKLLSLPIFKLPDQEDDLFPEWMLYGDRVAIFTLAHLERLASETIDELKNSISHANFGRSTSSKEKAVARIMHIPGFLKSFDVRKTIKSNPKHATSEGSSGPAIPLHSEMLRWKNILAGVGNSENTGVTVPYCFETTNCAFTGLLDLLKQSLSAARNRTNIVASSMSCRCASESGELSACMDGAWFLIWATLRIIKANLSLLNRAEAELTSVSNMNATFSALHKTLLDIVGDRASFRLTSAEADAKEQPLCRGLEARAKSSIVEVAVETLREGFTRFYPSAESRIELLRYLLDSGDSGRNEVLAVLMANLARDDSMQPLVSEMIQGGFDINGLLCDLMLKIENPCHAKLLLAFQTHLLKQWNRNVDEVILQVIVCFTKDLVREAANSASLAPILHALLCAWLTFDDVPPPEANAVRKEIENLIQSKTMDLVSLQICGRVISKLLSHSNLPLIEVFECIKELLEPFESKGIVNDLFEFLPVAISTTKSICGSFIWTLISSSSTNTSQVLDMEETPAEVAREEVLESEFKFLSDILSRTLAPAVASTLHSLVLLCESSGDLTSFDLSEIFEAILDATEQVEWTSSNEANQSLARGSIFPPVFEMLWRLIFKLSKMCARHEKLQNWLAQGFEQVIRLIKEFESGEVDEAADQENSCSQIIFPSLGAVSKPTSSLFEFFPPKMFSISLWAFIPSTQIDIVLFSCIESDESSIRVAVKAGGILQVCMTDLSATEEFKQVLSVHVTSFEGWNLIAVSVDFKNGTLRVNVMNENSGLLSEDASFRKVFSCCTLVLDEDSEHNHSGCAVRLSDVKLHNDCVLNQGMIQRLFSVGRAALRQLRLAGAEILANRLLKLALEHPQLSLEEEVSDVFKLVRTFENQRICVDYFTQHQFTAPMTAQLVQLERDVVEGVCCSLCWRSSSFASVAKLEDYDPACRARIVEDFYTSTRNPKHGEQSLCATCSDGTSSDRVFRHRASFKELLVKAINQVRATKETQPVEHHEILEVLSQGFTEGALFAGQPVALSRTGQRGIIEGVYDARRLLRTFCYQQAQSFQATHAESFSYQEEASLYNFIVSTGAALAALRVALQQGIVSDLDEPTSPRSPGSPNSRMPGKQNLLSSLERTCADLVHNHPELEEQERESLLRLDFEGFCKELRSPASFGPSGWRLDGVACISTESVSLYVPVVDLALIHEPCAFLNAEDLSRIWTKLSSGLIELSSSSEPKALLGLRRLAGALAKSANLTSMPSCDELKHGMLAFALQRRSDAITSVASERKNNFVLDEAVRMVSDAKLAPLRVLEAAATRVEERRRITSSDRQTTASTLQRLKANPKHSSRDERCVKAIQGEVELKEGVTTEVKCLSSDAQICFMDRIDGSPSVFLSGSHFFEFTLLSTGQIKIGCSTPDGDIWMLDGATACLVHGEESAEITRDLTWKAGDVIGVALDCEERTLSYFCNGDFVDMFEDLTECVELLLIVDLVEGESVRIATDKFKFPFDSPVENEDEDEVEVEDKDGNKISRRAQIIEALLATGLPREWCQKAVDSVARQCAANGSTLDETAAITWVMEQMMKDDSQEAFLNSVSMSANEENGKPSSPSSTGKVDDPGEENLIFEEAPSLIFALEKPLGLRVTAKTKAEISRNVVFEQDSWGSQGENSELPQSGQIQAARLLQIVERCSLQELGTLANALDVVLCLEYCRSTLIMLLAAEKLEIPDIKDLLRLFRLQCFRGPTCLESFHSKSTGTLESVRKIVGRAPLEKKLALLAECCKVLNEASKPEYASVSWGAFAKLGTNMTLLSKICSRDFKETPDESILACAANGFKGMPHLLLSDEEALEETNAELSLVLISYMLCESTTKNPVFSSTLSECLAQVLSSRNVTLKDAAFRLWAEHFCCVRNAVERDSDTLRTAALLLEMVPKSSIQNLFQKRCQKEQPFMGSTYTGYLHGIVRFLVEIRKLSDLIAPNFGETEEDVVDNNLPRLKAHQPHSGTIILQWLASRSATSPRFSLQQDLGDLSSARENERNEFDVEENEDDEAEDHAAVVGSRQSSTTFGDLLISTDATVTSASETGRVSVDSFERSQATSTPEVFSLEVQVGESKTWRTISEVPLHVARYSFHGAHPDTTYRFRMIKESIGTRRLSLPTTVSRRKRSTGPVVEIDTRPGERIMLTSSACGENLILQNLHRSVRNPVNKKWNAVRTNLGFSSGKHHWEVKIDQCVSKNIFIGICTADAEMSNYVGSDPHGWAYLSNRAVWHNKAKLRGYGEIYRQGDVIGVVLDCDQGTLAFTRNGVDYGIAVEDLPFGEVFYPAVSLYNEKDALTLNFDAEDAAQGLHGCDDDDANANEARFIGTASANRKVEQLLELEAIFKSKTLEKTEKTIKGMLAVWNAACPVLEGDDSDNKGPMELLRRRTSSFPKDVDDSVSRINSEMSETDLGVLKNALSIVVGSKPVAIDSVCTLQLSNVVRSLAKYGEAILREKACRLIYTTQLYEACKPFMEARDPPSQVLLI